MKPVAWRRGALAALPGRGRPGSSWRFRPQREEAEAKTFLDQFFDIFGRDHSGPA